MSLGGGSRVRLVMVRRVLSSGLLAVLPILATSVAMIPAADPVGATPPASIQNCMDAGWRALTDASGHPFLSQGQCISYRIHHPVSLVDLAGSFSGTTSFTFGPADGCPLVSQFFDASYPGSSAVGSVTLHLGGCALFGLNESSYTGTFAIATSVGTLAGSAAGPVSTVNPPLFDSELTLTVLSGTNAFTGTTGALHLSIEWQLTDPSSSPATGSVSVS
jgi:hypothetical protein